MLYFSDAPHLPSNKQKVAGILLLRAMESSSQGNDSWMDYLFAFSLACFCLFVYNKELAHVGVRLFACISNSHLVFTEFLSLYFFVKHTRSRGGACLGT